jgi:hypothetical protein
MPYLRWKTALTAGQEALVVLVIDECRTRDGVDRVHAGAILIVGTAAVVISD